MLGSSGLNLRALPMRVYLWGRWIQPVEESIGFREVSSLLDCLSVVGIAQLHLHLSFGE
jgi:hypothetical protein